MTRVAQIFFAGWAALTVACCAAAPTLAQTPAADAKASALTTEQKQLIYQSVSATHKNSAAPPGFRAAVGAQVPPGIDLQPMPGAVVTVVPSVKDMDVAMIEKQVVLVDRKSRKVLAVVTHSE
jgi:hypothetical protein